MAEGSGSLARGPVRLAVVLAGVNTHEGLRKVQEGLKRWTSLTGPACSGAHRRRMGFYLYLNRQADVLDVAAEETGTRRMVAEALGGAARCFSQHGVVYAGLEGEDDAYPAGPSNMFYAVWGDGEDDGAGGGSAGGSTGFGFGGRWDAMFWMEPDVSPVRGMWLDAVYTDAQVPGGFWLRGSIMRDPYLDRQVTEKTSGVGPTPGATGSASQPVQTAKRLHRRLWEPHYNGVALYDLRDERFARYVRLAKRSWPPTGHNHAWDVALYVTLHDFHARYAEYRTYAHLLQYTTVVQNLGGSFGFDPGDVSVVRRFAEANPGTYLVHWSPKAAKAMAARSAVHGGVMGSNPAGVADGKAATNLAFTGGGGDDDERTVDADDSAGIATVLETMGALRANRLGASCAPGRDMPSLVDMGVSYAREPSEVVVGDGGASKLPPGGRRWPTCVVVANGGHLRKTRYGKTIDAAAAVARVNVAPVTDRHAGMVGTKTTLRIVAPGAAQEGSANRGLPRGAQSMGNAPLVHTASPSGSGSKSAGGPRLEPKLVDRARDFLFSFRSCLKEMGVAEFEGGHEPSTGFLAAYAMREMCDQVTVFGAGSGAGSKSNPKNRYWQSDAAAGSPGDRRHSFAAEQWVLRHLARSGFLTYCQVTGCISAEGGG